MNGPAQTRSRHAAAPKRQGRKKQNACPICGKISAQPYRPFCSKHCADIDLGRWLGGRYAIPGPPVEGPETDSEDGPDEGSPD